MSAETFSLISDLLHYGVFAVLVVALLFFLAQFVVPGLRVGRELKAAHAAISALKREGPVLDLDQVAAQAMPGTTLAHGWAEFRDTLHGQKRADEFGALQVIRWRATALAQGFFTAGTTPGEQSQPWRGYRPFVPPRVPPLCLRCKALLCIVLT